MKYYATDFKAPMNLYENRRYINFMIMIMIIKNANFTIFRKVQIILKITKKLEQCLITL